MEPRVFRDSISRALVIAVFAALLCGNVVAAMCTVDPKNPGSRSCGHGIDTNLFASKSSSSAPTVPGLSLKFYAKTCPKFATIVQQAIASSLSSTPFAGAGLVRVMFHDCFIQGCDSSLLLTGAGSEQGDIPNVSLRAESLQLVDTIKAQLEQACPNTVSCADILSQASTEVIRQSKGPSIKVPLGRRDGTTFASASTVNGGLPSPFNNVSANFPDFTALNFGYTDMVALSGAHTIGQAECSSFTNRLRPTVDPTLDTTFANSLSQQCPAGGSGTTRIGMDSTPTTFDNNYFKQVLTGDVLITSDASLELDANTLSIVKSYARSNSKFNSQFVTSFLKMSQLSVLTGTSGTIRKVCTVAN